MTELEQLASIFINLGASPESARVMASQLDKRAQQLAAETGRTYAEAMAHLLSLVQKARQQ